MTQPAALNNLAHLEYVPRHLTTRRAFNLPDLSSVRKISIVADRSAPGSVGHCRRWCREGRSIPARRDRSVAAVAGNGSNGTTARGSEAGYS
jgi:hypothetical protein